MSGFYSWKESPLPKFLIEKLKKEYPGDKAAPYKIANSLGAMKGSKITRKGEEMEKKHQADRKKGLAK